MNMNPALTAEEWRYQYAKRHDKGADDHGVYSDGTVSTRGWTVADIAGQIVLGFADAGPPLMMGLVDTLRHPLAAFCLHGQEYGFTQEMVVALRDALACSGAVSSPDNLPLAERAVDLIEDLLPPKETTP